MAKRKVNKTKMILSYCEKHPDAPPQAVAEALSKKGVKINAAYVSNVKSNAKKKEGQPKRKVGRPRKSAAVAGETVSVDALVEAKKFADRVGGVDTARKLIDAFGKLQ